MRKSWIDNLRGGVVLLVVFYHVIYMYNSLGIIRNITVEGLPWMDTLLYPLYPWFMVTLFVLAGISARYALGRTDDRSYLKSRVRRLLIPGVAPIFLIGWTSGYVTSRYADMFGGNGAAIPGVVKYLIYSFAGIGVLWFVQQLFVCTLVLLLIRKIDRNGKLAALGEKTGLLALVLLCVPAWGSAQILNLPVVEVHRNGIYIFYFLLGYYVFSAERVQALLKQHALWFMAAGAALCVAYTVYYHGQNFTLMANLKSPLCNAFAWFGTLGALRYWDRESRFTVFMRRNGFAIYALHMTLMVGLAFGVDQLTHLRGFALYPVLAALEALCLPALIWLVRRIPVLRRLILGE